MDEQSQRIHLLSQIIWGEGDYEIDVEGSYVDYGEWMCYVKKDFGDSFGPPLTMTTVCNTQNKAWNELERMLTLWVKSLTKGKPMSREERMEIFGGPRGEHRGVIAQFLDMKARIDATDREAAKKKEAKNVTKHVTISTAKSATNNTSKSDTSSVAKKASKSATEEA